MLQHQPPKKRNDIITPLSALESPGSVWGLVASLEFSLGEGNATSLWNSFFYIRSDYSRDVTSAQGVKICMADCPCTSVTPY